MEEVKYVLTKEDLSKIAYEYSPEGIKKAIDNLQTQLSQLFQKIIKVTKHATQKRNSGMQDSSKIKEDSLKIKEDSSKIKDFEQRFINIREYISYMILLYKVNLNKTNVEIRFNSENDKKCFLENIKKRYCLLENYQKNIDKLETMDIQIRYEIEKNTLSNVVKVDEFLDNY
jgi:hypothetical protein